LRNTLLNYFKFKNYCIIDDVQILIKYLFCIKIVCYNASLSVKVPWNSFVSIYKSDVSHQIIQWIRNIKRNFYRGLFLNNENSIKYI
jgi:hypothetical protein